MFGKLNYQKAFAKKLKFEKQNSTTTHNYSQLFDKYSNNYQTTSFHLTRSTYYIP